MRLLVDSIWHVWRRLKMFPSSEDSAEHWHLVPSHRECCWDKKKLAQWCHLGGSIRWPFDFDLKYLKYPNHLICSFILTLSMERPMWHSTKRSLGFVSLEEALCKPFTCHTTCTKGSLMPWSNHTFYRVWPSNHYWVFISGTPQNKSKAGHKPSPNMGSSWMLNVFQRKLWRYASTGFHLVERRSSPWC